MTDSTETEHATANDGKPVTEVTSLSAMRAQIAYPPSLLLYRYYKLEDEWVLPAMRDNTLKLSSPWVFNDPFDCHLSPSSYGIGDERSRAFIFKHTRGRDRSQLDSDVSRLSGGSLEVAAADLLRALLLAMLGVSCFSLEGESPLMWSHYTRGYRGFCVQYAVSREELLKLNGDLLLAEVNYATAYPRISARALMGDYGDAEGARAVVSLVSTKSIGWSYEREWRLVTFGGEKTIQNPFRATQVALGCGLSEEERQMVIEAFRERDVRFVYAEPDIERFVLALQPVSRDGEVTHGVKHFCLVVPKPTGTS